MDDFVRKKLTEWGLREWIDNFRGEVVKLFYPSFNTKENASSDLKVLQYDSSHNSRLIFITYKIDVCLLILFLIIDQGVDEESFFCLGDTDINDLISKVGPRAKFKKRFQSLQVILD